MAGDFISDQEFEQLNKAGKVKDHAPDFISDDDYANMVGSDRKGAAMAGLEHFGQSASLGYLPQLQSAVEPVAAKVGDLITGQHVSDDLPGYVQRRDENIKRLSEEEKEHPGASIAGSIGGGLATGIATSPLLPAKAATLLGRTKQAAGISAALGAISNPGDEEGEVSPIQAQKRAQSALISSALGIPLHLLGEGAEALGKFGTGKLRALAESKAFKSLGPDLRSVRQNSDDINGIGRTLLDSGVVQAKPTGFKGLAERANTLKEGSGQEIERIVDNLADADGVPALSRGDIASQVKSDNLIEPGLPGAARRNAAVRRLVGEFEHHGEMQTSIPLSEDDSALENLKLKYGRPQEQTLDVQPPKQISRDLPSGVNKREGFEDLARAYRERHQALGQIDQANLAAVNDSGFNPYADRPSVQVMPVEKTGVIPNDEIPLRDARDIKGRLKSAIKWDRLPGADIPLDEQVNRSLYSQVRKGEDDIATRLASEGKVPDGAKFLSEKKKYGDLATAEAIASKKADRESANRFLGLSDYLAGGTGAGVGAYVGDKFGGPEGAKMGAEIGGGVGALGNKAMRTYGNQVAAVGADKLASLLAQSSPRLAAMLKGNPQLAPLLMNMLNQHQKPNAAPSEGAPMLGETDRSVAGGHQSQIVSPDEAKRQFLSNGP